MVRSIIGIAGAAFAVGILASCPAGAADTVMQQCGQQYQAAKAGGTLNGQTWNQYRVACAARLKAQPVSTGTPAAAPPEPAPAPTPAATPAAPPPPAPATTAAAPPPPTPSAGAAAPPASGGRAAMLTREKECGAEWRANKVTLVAQTPGLTWPKYWSQCNTRLKAAGK